MVWLQTELGKGTGDTAQSWSEALLGSLNFWGLLEGTHLISLMLFAGTIFVVDLRLLGVTFRRTPVSVVSDRVLPLTVAGFLMVIATGLLLFFAKPLFYYHNLWFRAKMVFLVLAMINIAVFHFRVQRNQAAWDGYERPPASARASAALSLLAWLCVITMGRFIAYDWFECGKPIPHLVNVLQECKVSEKGAVDKEDMTKLSGATVSGGQGQ
ncbi:DUF6644 family protein [Phenylobacterium soli]|uniref:DUF6644 domain-containing protein n=1 Tax=Phenylobacterium soli TaxID=2170551 RepID=A0A328A9H7_9CAUL|nr:DUF6644 family protein [Phenylobacterium soli]RAK51165.1 hypothetical protein DJ017_19590 [Phenylobacterium soli]